MTLITIILVLIISLVLTLSYRKKIEQPIRTVPPGLWIKKKHKNYYNWPKAIAQLSKCQTNIELETLIQVSLEKSLSWVTCACGNLCSEIPRTRHGQPTDHTLSGLGTVFSEEWKRLREHYLWGNLGIIPKDGKSYQNTILPYQQRLTKILDRIEERAIRVLNEQRNEKG